jgi:hypothetical protein
MQRGMPGVTWIAADALIQEQCGFRESRLRTGALFEIKQVTGKKREYNLETRICFADFGQASDSMNKENYGKY